MSDKFWKSLSTDLQEKIKQAMKEATEFERKETAEDEERLLAKIEEYAKNTGKLKIEKLSPEQKAEWQKVMGAIYPKFYGVVGKDLIEKTIDTK